MTNTNGVNALSYEDLFKLNSNFRLNYEFNQDDSESLNTIRTFFPKRDGTQSIPQILDVIEFTDEFGEYFPNGKISSVSEDTLSVAGHGHIPFVNETSILYNFKNGIESIDFSMGGGPFFNFPIENLICVGTTEILVQTFSKHTFSAVHAAIEVPVQVNLWKMKNPINKYGDYSTKNYERTFVYFHKDFDSGYASSFLGGRYWNSKVEYEQWLNKYRGVSFLNEDKTSAFVWHYFDKLRYCSSKEEYEKLTSKEIVTNNGEFDCEIMNLTLVGSKSYITRVIDNTHHVITEYRLNKID